MPDRDGAMTMGEIIEAWNKDKRHVAELEGEHALLLAHCKVLEAKLLDVTNEKRALLDPSGTLLPPLKEDEHWSDQPGRHWSEVLE